MTLTLPEPVAAYFTADLGDRSAIAQCFNNNAAVKDERHTCEGLSAIKQWKSDSAKKYTYTCEPFAVEEKDGRTIVSGHLAGNFPGSPIDMRYFFGIDGNKVASLEIEP